MVQLGRGKKKLISSRGRAAATEEEHQNQLLREKLGNKMTVGKRVFFANFLCVVCGLELFGLAVSTILLIPGITVCVCVSYSYPNPTQGWYTQTPDNSVDTLLIVLAAFLGLNPTRYTTKCTAELLRSPHPYGWA